MTPVVSKIINECAAKHHTTRDEVLSDAKHRAPACARHEAMWQTRQLRETAICKSAYSYRAIGRMFGRDVGSVIRGCRAHKARMEAQG